NLVAGTAYHFRAVSTNSTGTSSGADVEFVTPVPLTPTVTTLAASEVTTSAAVLNGTVNPNGRDTTAWFEWGTTTNYGNATAVQAIPAGTNLVPILAVLSNLVPGTVYHFRAVGTNSLGVSFGTDFFFLVPIPAAPTVITLDASGLS